MTEVRVRRLPHAEGLPELRRHSSGASGFDLVAAISREVELRPGERQVVSTGVAIELPVGLEAQVRPRSGLAARLGVTVLNTPGTIDADYRGEVKVILINLGQSAVTVSRGDRIAQLVFAPVAMDVAVVDVDRLGVTDRSDGGFGSTGVG